MARASTTHAPPPKPCKKRAATKIAILGESAAIAEAKSATLAPATSSRRLPMTSEIGPTISCPSAMPTKNPDRVSCTTESGAPNSAPTAGRVGRYISVAKGAVADNSANASVVLSYTVYDCAIPGCTGKAYTAKTTTGDAPPATPGGSIMNSCYPPDTNGEFTSSDITGLQYLY